MRIGIVTTQVPFVQGGAESHARVLMQQLTQRGFEADIIALPFKWYPPERIIDSIAMARMLDLTEANGQPIDRVIGLKFPAYLVPHPNKVLWILHQHRTAYELWDHPRFGDLINFPDGRLVRDTIHYADNRYIPEAKAIYANSRNIADRLMAFNGIDAPPLYHPPAFADLFTTAEPEPYFFFPSRVSRLKRHDLVIAAIGRTSAPCRVVFAGSAEDPDYKTDLERMAAELGVSDRIVWQGFVSEEAKRSLYARALAVIYPPLDEDYGYVTLEAMLSHKAVLTATDSGGPLEFVIPEETGLVVSSDPASLAEGMDRLWADPALAQRMGKAARSHYDSSRITWDAVIEVLTS